MKSSITAMGCKVRACLINLCTFIEHPKSSEKLAEINNVWGHFMFLVKFPD